MIRPIRPGLRVRIFPRAALPLLLLAAALGMPADALADRIDVPIIEPTDDPATFLFNPEEATAAVGDTVAWINVGQRPHRVRLEGATFDSGLLRPGSEGLFVPREPGTFAYACAVHPMMRGTLIIQDGLGAGPSPAGQRR